MHGRVVGHRHDYFVDPKVETVIDYGMVMSFWYDPTGTRLDDYSSVAFGDN
jgi:hypothetical protein